MLQWNFFGIQIRNVSMLYHNNVWPGILCRGIFHSKLGTAETGYDQIDENPRSQQFMYSMKPKLKIHIKLIV